MTTTTNPTGFYRSVRREKGARFCAMTIKLSDGRLSITGEAGRIVSKAKAARETRETWENYFDDVGAGETLEFIREHRPRSRATSAKYAAKLLIELETAAGNVFHGLDTVDVIDGRVYVLESCGQIQDELAEWFPEAIPLFEHHLNDLNAGCEHQDALGWGAGHDVTLAIQDMTPMQITSLTARNRKRTERHAKQLRKDVVKTRSMWAAFVNQATLERTESGNVRTWVEDVRRQLQHVNLDRMPLDAQDEDEAKVSKSVIAALFIALQRIGSRPWRADVGSLLDQLNAYVLAQTTAGVTSEIFGDSIGAPCPTCGYRYGTAWLKRELPANIVELARTVAGDAP